MKPPHEIRLESLFLHDTQTAQLCRAQALLSRRAAGLGLPESPPFRFAPPFCPLNRGIDLRGERLCLGTPRVVDGWILMNAELPVQGTPEVDPHRNPSREGVPQLPGYPPLPGVPAFILGYYGPRASELLFDPGLSEILPKEFSVRAWYRAELCLRFTEPGGGCVSAEWEIRTPRWFKATQ